MWCLNNKVGKMWKLLVLLALINFAIAQDKINQQLINKNVERTVDLSSQLVKITVTITLENTGKEPARNFHVVLEPKAGTLSHIGVKDSLKDDLEISPGATNESFKVNLNQAIPGGRTSTVILELIFTSVLEPYPSSITQKDKQLVRYFGNHYFYSPYRSLKQTTGVTLNSRSVESYTKLKPVSYSDSLIAYGPYNDVAPLSVDPMLVHYENNAPFLSVTNLVRVIEISHWGNIAVEETIDILHTGAKLKGSFSRYDYQRDTTGAHHSIKSYKTILPATAYNIYYRDSNGNISTSQIRQRKDWIELELRPRFPLFGGWRSSYTLGYSVPSYQHLYKKSNNEFILNMRLLDHIFDDMQVDQMETAVVLPVGVTNVKITTPYEVERLSDDVTYKYLDNMGRIVVRLRKTNLVEQHIQDFEVTYNWQSLLLFHEPILLTIALYVLFIFVIVYVRLDFSIYKPEHAKKE